MGRILLGTLVGAVAIYVWGMVFWMVTPLPTMAIKHLPQEASTMTMLQGQLGESGVYSFPGITEEEAAATDDACALCMEKFKKGPVGVLFYHKQGFNPMSASVMGMGFGIDVLCALAGAWLLSAARLPGFGQRLLFLIGLGVVAAISTHAKEANWMFHHPQYAAIMSIDTIGSWVFAGIAMAGIIKPPVADPEMLV